MNQDQDHGRNPAASPPEGFLPAPIGGMFATHASALFARWQDGVLALRASGVFRRGPLLPDTGSDQALRLPGMPVR